MSVQIKFETVNYVRFSEVAKWILSKLPENKNSEFQGRSLEDLDHFEIEDSFRAYTDSLDYTNDLWHLWIKYVAHDVDFDHINNTYFDIEELLPSDGTSYEEEYLLSEFDKEVLQIIGELFSKFDNTLYIKY